MSCIKFILITTIVIICTLSVLITTLFSIPPLPEFKNEYWGPESSTKNENTNIIPFKINVSENVLVDLKNRLNNARPLTQPLEGIQHEYGINTNLLSEIVEFWKNRYNWRERETYLNKYPQFKTKIQGLNIHYIHVKPKITKGVRIIPILLVHGWSTSFREFSEIIPILTTPKNDVDFVFEVIVPSLPGHGFSDTASKPGLGDIQMGVLFQNLMQRLGHNKYYLQGGDWGSSICMHMSTLYPDTILGFHSNFCYNISPASIFQYLIGAIYPSMVVEKEFTNKLYPIKNIFNHILANFGYMHIQATKPDTIGVGLNDSPIGLAAYLFEKYIAFTNFENEKIADGGLSKFTYTDLLDNIMIYWVTGSITSSMRIYAESFNIKQRAYKMGSIPIKVPTACARFEHEVFYQSDYLIKSKFTNHLQSTYNKNVGHYPGLEAPQILAEDIWSAMIKFEDYHKTLHSFISR